MDVFFSDRPSSQFKNRYIVRFLSEMRESSELSLRWHYFATSHGKGAVDGVGGTVKRCVWSAAATRKISKVDDAVTFAKAATEYCDLSIRVVLVTKEEIRKKYPEFGVDSAAPVPGISKMHCIEPIGRCTVHLRKFSTQDKVTSVNVNKRQQNKEECIEKEVR